MRNKWIKRFFPIIVLLLLAPWPVAYAHAHTYTDDMVVQDAVQMEVAEVSEATNTAQVDTIIAPAGILPSHVYVLNNREIVTEETLREINSSEDTAVESTSHSQTASPSGTIRASVKGASSRLIVVDESDRIVEIWSNTTGTKRGFYSLRVKEQQPQGPEHPLTQEILAQYNRLLGQVDWTERDQVYSLTVTDYAN